MGLKTTWMTRMNSLHSQISQSLFRLFRFWWWTSVVGSNEDEVCKTRGDAACIESGCLCLQDAYRHLQSVDPGTGSIGSVRAATICLFPLAIAKNARSEYRAVWCSMVQCFSSWVFTCWVSCSAVYENGQEKMRLMNSWKIGWKKVLCLGGATSDRLRGLAHLLEMQVLHEGLFGLFYLVEGNRGPPASHQMSGTLNNWQILIQHTYMIYMYIHSRWFRRLVSQSGFLFSWQLWSRQTAGHCSLRRDTDDDGWAGRAPVLNTFVKRLKNKSTSWDMSTVPSFSWIFHGFPASIPSWFGETLSTIPICHCVEVKHWVCFCCDV